ncbi:MAG: hypothetical protein LUQ57_03460 [Methylococcaceae bacterium]|nr:hypothetical protein [Methylococcaceae bacterium]
MGLLLYAEAIHSMPQPSQHHLRQGGAVCKTKQKPDGTGGHADAVGGACESATSAYRVG